MGCVFFFHGTSDMCWRQFSAWQVLCDPFLTAFRGEKPRNLGFFRWWWTGWSNKVMMDLWWPNNCKSKQPMSDHIPITINGTMVYLPLHEWLILFNGKCNIPVPWMLWVLIQTDLNVDGWWFAWCSLLQSPFLFVIPKEYLFYHVLSGKEVQSSTLSKT